jgi:hypothetical protein
MMAVLDLVEDGGEFAAEPLRQPHAKDLTDLVGGQTPQADFAASLEVEDPCNPSGPCESGSAA